MIDITTIKSKTAGIYYFKNIEQEKYYIGQSVDIRKRFLKHI